MKQSVLRLACVAVIGGGALFASPDEARADPPQCAPEVGTMCSPPPGLTTCYDQCDNTSTGYLLQCEYRAVCGES